MEDWFWEGNVVAAVASFLKQNGWSIESIADTEKREAGVDIRATQARRVLLVEVKGYPATIYQRGIKKGQPKPTKPNVQARHWFSHVLLSAILRQADNPGTEVAIALPSFPVFTNLVQRTQDALNKLGLIIYFVQETGEVQILLPKESR
jgi:hypothetical protein